MLNRELHAPITGHDPAHRTVTVRMLRWNDVRDVNDFGIRYREQFAPGSITLADDVHVRDEHGGRMIGRVLTDSYDDDGDGPTVDLVLAGSGGDDMIAMIAADVIRSVSIEFQPIEPPAEFRPDPGEIVTRSSTLVHGIAFAFRAAHSTEVLAVREQTDTETENPEMTNEATATITAPDPVEPSDVRVVALERSVDELRDDLERARVAAAPPPSAAGHPLMQFRDLAEYTAAAYDDPTLHRALVDQITDNNPGVMPPAWLTEIAGIINGGTPLISAIGSAPLPATGMEVTYPYYDGDLSTLVGEQITEKGEITSARVDILSGTAPVRTFAGGSDVSYQLIRRSAPAYLTAYMRIMAAAYAKVTDTAASTALTTAATASGATWAPGGTLEALAAALFEASDEVDVATGTPASVALASPDMFRSIGSIAVASSTPYGVQNVAGTASASTLTINVSGLPVVKCPGLVPGSLIVTNTQASTWHSDGPFTVSAEDVAKLGQNVAVWGMGAYVAPIPTGIRSIPAAVTTGSGKAK